MTIPVEISQDVTVRISVEDIATALREACTLHEPRETVNALAEMLRAINASWQFLKALPDEAIAGMSEKQRRTIYAGLSKQVARFQEKS